MFLMTGTMKKRKRLGITPAWSLLLIFMLTFVPARGATAWWTCHHCDCNRLVTVTGSFQHPSNNINVIRGTNFRVSIPDLDPGIYRVALVLPLSSKHQRIPLEISSRGKKPWSGEIATGFHDGSIYSLSFRVPFDGMAADRPLILEFRARKAWVSLKSLEISNSQGQAVVSMEMKDLVSKKP
jgi:hypothetical protein